MVAGGQFDDAHASDVDTDAPWRRRPERAERSDANPAERPPDAPSPERRPIERIVLDDAGSTSVWARPSVGRGERSEHDRTRRERDDDASFAMAPGVAGSSTEAPRAAVSDGGPSSADPVETMAPGDDSGEDHGRHGVRRRSVVVALAGLLAISAVIASGLVIVGRGREPEPVAASTRELPIAAEVAWTRRIDGPVQATAVGDGLVVVASGDGITALSEVDGEVVWRRVNSAGAGDVERVAVMTGRVVVTQQGTTGATEVRAFDRENGTELWRTRGNDGSFSIVGPIHDPIIVGRSRVDEGTVLTLLDAADGTRLADPIRLSGVEVVGGDFASAPTDRKVAVWSADDLDVVAGPIDKFNLRTVAELDGAVVALDLESRIVVFDDAGRRTDELVLVGSAESLDGGVAAADVDFVGVTTSEIGVVSGESSVGFTVVDGRIETVWEHPGFVVEPVATSIGDRSVLITGGGADGELVESIFDPTTGSIIMPIEAPRPRERPSTLAWNGYVVAPMAGAAERVVVAVGYDGEQLWSLPVSQQADYEVTSSGVIVIDPRSDGADVSFAR